MRTSLITVAEIDWDASSSDYSFDEAPLEQPVDQYVSTKARISLKEWTDGLAKGASTYRIERRINRTLYRKELLTPNEMSKWLDSSSRLKHLLEGEEVTPSQWLQSLMQQMGMRERFEAFAERSLKQVSQSVERECQLNEQEIEGLQSALGALKKAAGSQPQLRRSVSLCGIKGYSKKKELASLSSRVEKLQSISKALDRVWKDIVTRTIHLRALKTRQLLISEQMQPDSFWSQALRFVGKRHA